MPAGLSPMHLAVVLVVALIVLGPEKLPEAARQVGRLLTQARELSARLSGDLQDAMFLQDAGDGAPGPTPADAGTADQRADGPPSNVATGPATPAVAPARDLSTKEEA